MRGRQVCDGRGVRSRIWNSAFGALLVAIAACGYGYGFGCGGGRGGDRDGGAPADAGPILPFDIPLGADAVRQWADAWPRLRLGVRAVMRSTHDPTGGNEYADASHFIRRDAAGLSVPLDLHGPGVLVFARHNHWHGSPWHYQVDGRETVVSETSSATPDTPVAGSIWEPAAAFPFPLARTWSETRGADLSWVASRDVLPWQRVTAKAKSGPDRDGR